MRYLSIVNFILGSKVTRTRQFNIDNWNYPIQNKIMQPKKPISKKIEDSIPVRYLYLTAAILGALGTVSAAVLAIYNPFSSEDGKMSYQGEICWYFSEKCMSENEKMFAFLDRNIGKVAHLNITVYVDNFEDIEKCTEFIGFQKSTHGTSLSLPVEETDMCLIQQSITFEDAIIRKAFDSRSYTNYNISGNFFIEKSISASAPAFFDYHLVVDETQGR